MASTTQADASAGAATQVVALPPPGMMLPVQALTTGFVHETLPLPLHAAQTPLPAQAAVRPLSPQAAAEAVAGQMPGAAAAWGLPGAALPGAAQTLGAGPATLAAQAGWASTGGAAMPLAAASAPMPAAATAAAPVAGVVAGVAPFGPAVFAPGAVADDTHSRQGVRIGDVGVMLTYEDSSELTDLPDLYYLPNAPVWVKGLANLHGNLVPVFDVAQYLGVQSSSPRAGRAAGANKPMLLVLGHGAGAAGIIVEGIPQRLVPTPQQQTDTDTAPALLMPHIQGAYFIDEQLWFDLNCDSLLDMLEQAMMDQA